jgi:hypothetical protein
MRRCPMASYYVNKQAQDNGDHEVHASNCPQMPAVGNKLYLGEFASCHGAVWEAKRRYTQVNGCLHCSRECHASHPALNLSPQTAPHS